MSDGAGEQAGEAAAGEPLSEAALLAGLRDIRLPPEAPFGALADLAVAAGLAAVAALIVLALMRAFGHIRPLSRALKPEVARARRLAAARALPADRRRVALLTFLRDEAPSRHQALSAALYRPDGVSLETLEVEAQKVEARGVKAGRLV